MENVKKVHGPNPEDMHKRGFTQLSDRIGKSRLESRSDLSVFQVTWRTALDLDDALALEGVAEI